MDALAYCGRLRNKIIQKEKGENGIKKRRVDLVHDV
jgi:hypothetical protein